VVKTNVSERSAVSNLRVDNLTPKNFPVVSFIETQMAALFSVRPVFFYRMLGRTRRRWEYNSKMEVREVGPEEGA
jgi:hypothetical protein